MSSPRSVHRVFSGIPTLEGAGVRLHRIFGHRETGLFDPFLMLDDFGSSSAEDYMAGFPWHPHRGIETVTYMLHGSVAHGDSLGNSGVIRDGQVQWMTAGRGIIHQEMPERQPDYLRGLQLWVNLPARQKMMEPRYRDVRAEDIPVIHTAGGAKVGIIAGRLGKTRGPVRDIVADPVYWDVRLPAGAALDEPLPSDYKVFVYVVEGAAGFEGRRETLAAGKLALFGAGERVSVAPGPVGVRFILAAGRPIGEPIAWRGPIVMNTDEELDLAFREYAAGTFIKK